MTEYHVGFADEKIREAFDKLEDSKVEDRNLHRWISNAIDDLKNDPYCGIQIQKRLIPKTYITKYHVSNLWKYDLPNAWRLIYFVIGDQVNIISIVLEWMDHKDYERRFKY